MKIQQGLDLTTQDFFYDLFDGGYLLPKKILVDEKDIEKVYNALITIQEFREAIEDEYPDFNQ